MVCTTWVACGVVSIVSPSGVGWPGRGPVTGADRGQAVEKGGIVALEVMPDQAHLFVTHEPESLGVVRGQPGTAVDEEGGG